MKFKSDIEVQAGLKDSSGAIGASGQVLSSTGSNVSWVNQTTVANDVQNRVKAGVTINKGQAVYVTGADGTNIIVGLASNATEATSSKTLGLLNATVAINGMADVVQIGRLSGLNTLGAVAGDPVWLGTGGNLIYGLINKPYAPANLVFIGVVTRVNVSNGEIFVSVQNGFELKEIHDVDLITNVPINGDVLGYDGTLWVNKTIAQWLGFTPANASGTTNYVSKFTGTTTLGNSQIFDNGTNVGIGTTSPTQQLQTTGDAIIRNAYIGNIASFGTNYASFSHTSRNGVNDYSLLSDNVGITYLNASASQSLRFRINNLDKAILDSSGNFGIGTTSPSEKLHVMGNSIFNNSNNNGTTLRFVSNSNSIYGDAFILSPFSNCIFSSNITYNSASGYIYDKNGYGASVRLSGGSTNNGDIFFNTFTSGTAGATATELNRMTILNGGNVGIGTTTPVSIGSYTTLDLRGTNGSLLYMGQEGATASLRLIGEGTDGYIDNINISGSLLFRTNAATERMRITLGGNVGIGTSTPAYKLDVNGGGAFRDTLRVVSSGTDVAYLSWTSANTGVLSLLSGGLVNAQILASGNSYFNGGNVGIGTASPSQKLEVSGIALINGVLNSYATMDNLARRFNSPEGGSYITSSSSVTGAIKIKLPIARNNSATMMMFTVKIYQYSTGLAQEFQIAGYNYNAGGWYNPSVTNLSDSANNFTIRFGADATSDCVWIGETSSTWTYPQVFVTDFQAGYNGQSIDWATGWNVSFQTSFDTVELSRVASQVLTTNNISSFGITGSGTTNYVPKFTGITSLGNSLIYDNGTNVGIGTSSPLTALTVNGNLSLFNTNQIRLYNSAKNNWAEISSPLLGGDTEIDFKLVTKSGIVYVNPTGSVGIGTTSPANKLSVNGGASILGGTIPNGNGLHMYFSGNTGYILGFDSGVDWRNIDYNGLNHIFRTYDTERMRITSGGSLLLGDTITPSAPWRGTAVFGINGASKVIIGNLNSSYTGATIGGHTSALDGWDDLNIVGGNVIFRVNETERMRLATSGNVGIGTSAPSQKLDVIGNVNIGDGTNGDQNIRIRYGNFSGGYGAIRFDQAGSNNSTIHSFSTAWSSGNIYNASTGAININGANGVTFGAWDDIDVAFNTGGTSYFKNNLGIGTTSPALATNYKTLTLDGTSGTFTEYRQNGTPLFRIGADSSRPFLYGMTNASMEFFTNTSLRMTITGAGNVGIGTTSPSSKLQSSGSDLGIFSALALENLISTNPASGNGVAIDFRINNSGNPSYVAGKISLVNTFYRSNTDMTFSVANADTLSERMRITSAGNVCIGSTSSTYKLSVVTSSTNGLFINTSGSDFGNPSIAMLNGSTDSTISATSNGLEITTYSSHPMLFRTNTSERMRIDTSGNVGIGTSMPSAKLDIVDTMTNPTLRLAYVPMSGYGGGGNIDFVGGYSDYVSGAISWKNGTTVQGQVDYTGFNRMMTLTSQSTITFRTTLMERMRIDSTGQVGIGTSSPMYTLHVNGSVAGTSAYINLSDERYKKDILPIENALDKVLSLNGVTFNWNKEFNPETNLDDTNHIGLIAQEVEKIIPQAVSTASDDNQTKSVAYSDLVPVLIEAIKELKSEIEELKKLINK